MQTAFICHRGELEVKSMLLAASLRKQYGDTIAITAGIPQMRHLSKLSKATERLFDILKIEKYPFENDLDKQYPIGNKVSAFKEHFAGERVLFLDSDVLCLKAIDESQLFRKPLNLKPADVDSYTRSGGDWKAVYAAFDLTVTDGTSITSTVSEEVMPPYYNSGVIAVQNDFDFWTHWLATAHRIIRNAQIPSKFPWLDQLALPIMAIQLGMEIGHLTENHNFPLHYKSTKYHDPISFCHYHWPEVICREAEIHQYVLELTVEWPELIPVMRAYSNWRKLLSPYRLARKRRSWFFPMSYVQHAVEERHREKEEDWIITGIPRSGTSYFSRRFDQVDDRVVINEPEEIYPILGAFKKPHGLPIFYDALRTRILDGKWVRNKEYKGEIIEDTAKRNTIELVRKYVQQPSFGIATKNTTAYLMHANRIKDIMPTAPFIVCVRNPFDTIASWKQSFDHLKAVDVRSANIGSLSDPFLSDWQRRALEDVDNETDVRVRRAQYWHFLASCIDRIDGPYHLVRYEAFVSSPEKPERMLIENKYGDRQEKIEIRPTGRLSQEETDIILRICGPLAASFGYEIQ